MPRFEQDFLDSYDEAAILAELRRIASVTGASTVSKADIERVGRLSYSVIYKRFGSLRKALQKAGLRVHRFTNPGDEELLEILLELWTSTLGKEGRRPYRSDLNKYGYSVSGDTFTRGFGSWKKALMRANEYASADATQEQESEVKLSANDSRTSGASKPRKDISIRKKFFVFKRDHYTCQLCRKSGVPIELDHITPHSRGGSDALDNLQTLCFDCNRGKRDSLQ